MLRPGEFPCLQWGILRFGTATQNVLHQRRVGRYLYIDVDGVRFPQYRNGQCVEVNRTTALHEVQGNPD